MRKRTRTRVRSRGAVVLNSYSRMVALFAYEQKATKWRDWTFRTISQRQAELLVATGEAQAISRLHQGVVRIVGYRATKPVMCEQPSCTSLTLHTTIAVGNAVGKPSDVRMGRREREELARFQVWGLVGDSKAPRVGPRMSEADVKRAQRVLHDGKVDLRAEAA